MTEQITDKKIKILLVEDDPMIVDMYKLRLEEEGYEVAHTDIGSQALALAKEARPDIVLLDVILPEMDGFTILQALKTDEATRTIPVIMLTNLGQEGDQSKGEQRGADAYLVKARHTPAEVLAEVKKFVKKTVNQ